jgi:uncharacterized protein (DUF3084 family)
VARELVRTLTEQSVELYELRDELDAHSEQLRQARREREAIRDELAQAKRERAELRQQIEQRPTRKQGAADVSDRALWRLQLVGGFEYEALWL